MHIWSRITSLLVAALVAAACGGADPEAPPTDSPAVEGGLQVVATTTIIGDIARQVIGDAGTVEVLMQPGQDPHGFALSAQQAQALRTADLVIANGLGLEETMTAALDAAEADGVEVLRLGEALDPIPYEGPAHDHGDHAGEHTDGEHAHEDHASEDQTGDEHAHEDHTGDEHSGDEHATEDHEEHATEGHDEHATEKSDEEVSLDPHVWLDPVRMAEAPRLIVDHLTGLDQPIPADALKQRAESVAADILAAHEQVATLVDQVPADCRQLVTDHNTLGYFANRYGFEVIGTVIPGASSQAEPSAQDFARLVETVQQTNVPAIFTDASATSDLARTLTGEVGRPIEIVELSTESLEGEGSEVSTYTELLTTNAERIANALGSC